MTTASKNTTETLRRLVDFLDTNPQGILARRETTQKHSTDVFPREPRDSGNYNFDPRDEDCYFYWTKRQ
jgi:hypothetical protein